MEEAVGRGKLVALEGDADIVSTQLRLLPPSQMILILPSILDSLPKLQGNDARSFVQHVHQLFTERTQHAHSFLGSSTSMHPRLVFTHGGSVNARSICIAWITESVADGNFDQAEVLFNEIVKDGVAGLMRREEKEEDSNTVAEDLVEEENNDRLEHTTEDASTTAMRAAECLDRETAGLELDQHVDDTEDILCGETPSVGHDGPKGFYYQVEDSDDDENTSSETPLMNSKSKTGKPMFNPQRSSKIPVRDLIFTASKGEEIKRTMLVLPPKASLWDRRNNSGTKIPQLTPFSTPSYSSVPTSYERSGSMIDDEFDIQSPETDLFPSTPVVVYGEACLVDMQSNASDSPPLRKVKSVDRMFPALLPVSHSVTSPKSLRQTASFCHPQARPMISESGSAIMSEYFQAVPRTTFVKASETTIRRSPTGSDCSVSSSSSIRAPLSKTMALDQDLALEAPMNTTSENQKAIFVPVFPVVEDLIINLNPTGSNVIFDAVLASYKNGSYPVWPKAESPVDSEAEDQLHEIRSPSTAVAKSDTGYAKKRLTYDPYDYKSSVNIQWPLKDFSKYRKNNHQDSSTPLKTGRISERVIDFSPLDSTNAVTLQNSLRKILSVHFPTSDGYSQHLYPVTEDMERLWKPVFKIDESGSIAESSRTVDQIVALGCEIGVKQDFFTQVSGQIERLGTRKNGMSRSGKMDIKYFIASVMQNQSSILPMPVDPNLSTDVLAQLIVPQLESFLSTNFSTRFLILHYTAAHLGVVLALQKLIGAGVFQVAGVLDTLSSDPPSFSRSRTPREINPLSNEATMSRPTSRKATSQSLKEQLSGSAIPPIPNAPKPQVSFSKANYLIPSIATDAEITIFLSGIWKSLMERSSYYNPELPEVEPPKPTVATPVIRPTTPRLTSAKSPSSVTSKPTFSSSDKTSYPPSSYRAPKSDKIARMAGRDGEVRHAKSIAASVRTTASEKGRREDKEWENFYIGDEDSEDDDYDKMIMGREFKMILPEQKVVKKRNTKKALKWLGLS